MAYVAIPNTARPAVTAGASAVAAASDLDTTQKIGDRLYLLRSDSACWYAQGPAPTAFAFASGNNFTVATHGYTTGWGPVQVTNSGGALPTGLTAATNYWIIVVDQNTIAFASSRANAIAGTAVTISGAGTGTQSLQVVATTGGASTALAEPAQEVILDGKYGAQVSVIQDTAPPTEVNVPATAGALTIFTGQGMLLSAVVTATGSTALTFQDGAGNIIGEVLSTATVGQVITFNVPFGTSLVANKATTTPVVTVAYQPLPAGAPAKVSVVQATWVR